MVSLTPRQWFWLALAATLAFRFWLGAAFPITGDEAYFVLWGRRPDLGFYDHPPMIGWLLAPLLAVSQAEWFVRLPAILLPAALALLVRHALAAWFARDAETADLAGLVVLLMPMNVWNVLITTDTPLAFFSVASLLAFARQRFLLAGVLLGFAFLSKYFAVLLGLGYLVWSLAARRPGAFAAAFLGALPAGLVNLYWNWQACWCNVMFNAINRHDDAGLSWTTPALYALSLAYLAAPLLWYAWQGRARLRAALPRAEVGVLAAAWLVPLVVFALISPVRRIGLHWLLAFMPALVLTLALVLERRALVVTLRWFGALAVLHVAAFIALALPPLEIWKDMRLYQRLVLQFDPAAVLAPLGPQLARYRLATEGYSLAALLAYHTRRSVPVFGAGSSHARHDDILTDWRRFDGRDLLIFRRDPPDLAHYRPYFREVEARPIEARGATHYAVLGRGFDYAAYRERVLAPVNERWYRIPTWLPVGGCYFFERYGFGRPR
ncbi:MAG: glycosyltransferase family 39 protein [Betaproteobacteria bacterium]|nr:glycosyltransferase family 39 protein [Betaproteobacteria bacterium]